MMARWSLLRWARGLARNVLHGAIRDADLRADVDSYVDMMTEEKVAAGMEPAAARRAAVVEFGSVEAVKDETRSVQAGAWLVQGWQDARYAGRMLRRDVGFSVLAVLTIALGIGANAAIFSVVHAVLLEPLPYEAPDRLALIWERNTAIGKNRDPVAPLNFYDWQEQSQAFEDLGAFRFADIVLNDAGNPEQTRALLMSSSMFRVLGVDAAVGRTFSDEEQRRREPVVVLAHAFWQRRFAGSPAVVGRSLVSDGRAFTIVGVMPPGFEFPDHSPVDVYSPLIFAPQELQGRRLHSLTVLGRLAGHATIEGARAELGAIARRIAAADNTSNPEVTIVGAHDALVEDVRTGLMILLGTVGLVLIIACVNVASLLLVRAAARRREIAIRSALGAGSGRLLRQLLTESVLLAGLGGAVGVAMAWSLLQALARLQPPGLPRVDHVAIDMRVLVFVSAAAVLTGLMFGIVPALQAMRPGRRDAASATSRLGRNASGRQRWRSALLVAEIALTVMLLAAAGLMIRSLFTLQNLDLGFRSRHVLTAQFLLPASRYPLDPRQFRPAAQAPRSVADSRPSVFVQQLEQQLEAIPGVESAGAVSALPLHPAGTDYDLPIVIEGRTPPPPGEESQADFRIATPGYFRTIGIPLLKGRAFTTFDGPNSTPVIIVNETMARQMFAGEDPLGQRIVLYGRPREIVGVVGAVRHHGFSREPRPEMIVPHRQFQLGAMTLVVRSKMEPSALGRAVTQSIHGLDADLAVSYVRMMDEFFSDSVAQPRFTTVLLAGFAGLALVLAFVGVYGVMSYTVSQRAPEIAVRMALGARRQEVVRLVAAQSMALAALGVLLGLSGAAAGTGLMDELLVGVTPRDPATFGAAAAILVLAALAATCGPALRATRVAPATILKAAADL